MTKEGAILVRPDEHIAWRVKSGLDGDPILEMRRVFFCNIEGKKKKNMHRRHGISVHDICACGVKSSTWNHDYTGAASILNWNAVFWSPLHYRKIFRTIEERLVVCRTCHAPDISHGCQSSRILPASVWVFQGFITLFWTWTRAILVDYFFLLSVAFRLKGWKTSPKTNKAVDWSLEKCLPCLWVDDDGENLQYILSFKLIVFWHHECSVFF